MKNHNIKKFLKKKGKKYICNFTILMMENRMEALHKMILFRVELPKPQQTLSFSCLKKMIFDELLAFHCEYHRKRVCKIERLFQCIQGKFIYIFMNSYKDESHLLINKIFFVWF